MRPPPSRPILFLVLTILLSAGCRAQSLWPDRSGRHSLAAEFLKLNLKEGDAYYFGTGALIFSYRGMVRKNMVLKVEVPFGLLNREGIDSTGRPADYSDHVFGNPYVGLELFRPRTTISTEAGVYIPANRSHWETSGIAQLTDADRREMFLRRVVALRVAVNAHPAVSANFRFLLSAGAIGWIGLDKEYLPDGFELFLPFVVQVILDSRYVSLRTGITGRYFVTAGENVDFADAVTAQFGVAVNGHFRNVHPGVLFRLPLSNDLANGVRSVIGIHCSVGL